MGYFPSATCSRQTKGGGGDGCGGGPLCELTLASHAGPLGSRQAVRLPALGSPLPVPRSPVPLHRPSVRADSWLPLVAPIPHHAMT